MTCFVRSVKDSASSEYPPRRPGNWILFFERLEAELEATRSYAACIGLVGAWARKPDAYQCADAS
jgi:hypothetical protein